MARTDTALVWVRSDLRLDDNPTLAAAADADRFLPVYVLDPRQYDVREYGGSNSFTYRKTGRHRTRFRLESIAALRRSLRNRDSDLVVARGRPETVLPRIAETVDADVVHLSTYPTPEEVRVEAAVKAALRDRDVGVERHWTHTLHHILDLPDGGLSVDDTFTAFKNDVEAHDEPRDPVDPPTIPPLPDLDGPDRGAVPSAADLLETDEDGATQTTDRLETDEDGATQTTDRLETDEDGATQTTDLPDPIGGEDLPGVERPDDRAALPFEGGEPRARDRLEQYVWEQDRLREYKETRNGLLGPEYSSKFSAWLAEGCLSPRRIYEEVKQYETERVANESTYWLVFELRWRDFFQFQFVKHGGRHFTRPGIRERTDIEWSTDASALRRWATGTTGFPFVDAAMRELNHTGYLSNRARQNAASFLANDLRLDWRKGAAYFETQLVDYDPCSNYGNWAYIAGVGNDSRDRSFDVLDQAHRYDDDAAYVKTWCPELEPLSPETAHEPWTLSDAEQRDHGVVLGEDYPHPVIDPETARGY